jgi:malonyl-CoA/methylmalonyl-CoA synthetase
MGNTTAHKFPNDLALVRLLIAAQQAADSDVIIHDVYGFEKTYPELLGDILQMRQIICRQLPATKTNEHGHLRQENSCIAVISKSGYEFIVAFFAIRAMGGACMPLSTYLHIAQRITPLHSNVEHTRP